MPPRRQLLGVPLLLTVVAAAFTWLLSGATAGRAEASSDDWVRWESTWHDHSHAQLEIGSMADCSHGPSCRAPGLVEATDGAGRLHGFQMGARQVNPESEVERWARVERVQLAEVPLEQRVARYEALRGEVSDEWIDHRISLIDDPRIVVPGVASVSEQVTAWIDGDGPDRLEIVLSLRPRPGWSVSSELTREVATGLLSGEDLKTRQQALARHYRDELFVLQEPLIANITANGGAVRERLWLPSRLRVEADRALASELIQRADVKRVHTGGLEVRLGYTDTVDGYDSAQGIGIESYHLDGYEGGEANPEQHSFGRITIGVIDTPFQSNTNAYLAHGTWSFQCSWGQCTWQWSPGPSRVVQIWDCRNAPCTNPSNMNALDQPLSVRAHGTMVAAIAAGDVTRSQDPDLSHPLFSLYNDEDRARRSGIAKQSGLVLLAAFPGAVGGSEGVLRSLNRAGASAVDVVNLSGFLTDQHHEPLPCASTDQAAQDVAEAIKELTRENDALFIGIAGNTGHAGTQCTVVPPGDATYAFTVGGTLNAENDEQEDCIVKNESGSNCSVADADCIRTAQLNDRSARGGTPYIDGIRNLVDTVAPAKLARVADPDGSYTCAGGPRGGTSVAAPQVAGSAAILKGAWIEQGYPVAMYKNPHLLFAALLLMGDRQTQFGTIRNSGYDTLFGNGRFEVNKLDSDGMQVPWGWETGSRWITPNQSQFVLINNGNPLPSGVTEIRATMWWPEPHVDNAGNNGSDIVVDLESTSSSGGNCGSSWSWVRSDSSWDTKKMVWAAAQPDRCYRLRILPFVVTSNPWENDAATRDVHWAYYFD
jgi:hypothetical protein